MQKRKSIVTDIYDFPTLIREGYVYVDKTALLRRLISGVDGRLFFMARPRRFGKSLMISTLEQIFKGEKALFKGLDIARTNYDWQKYPIIRLDMTAFDHTSGLSLFKRSLAAELGGKEPIAAFRALISAKARTSRGKGVVVLVDEYDSPVSGLLGKPTELEAMREFLQSFYRILKQESGQIRFLMMTGVSKFTKLSVFSGLNNLTDLSMEAEYAGLLGYTSGELTKFFGPQIKDFAKATEQTSASSIKELLSWYDSYRFSSKSETCVCNPVSVGCALKEKSCEAFWNRTGSSTLIIERLRKLGKLPLDVEAVEVQPRRLDICDLQNLPFDVLMYQGGYLTIKSVLENGRLLLDIPNREVREAIYGGFLDEVLKDSADEFTTAVYDVRKLFHAETFETSTLNRILTSAFAMVLHEWKMKSEAEAKRYFLLFMRMVGATINAEVESANGRADAILETEKTVYIFEFRYGKSAKEALKQCRDRKYAAPYADDRRSAILVGVNYNSKTHTIDVEVGDVSGEVNPRCGEVNGEVKSYISEHSGCRRKDILSAIGISPRTLDRQLASLSKSGAVELRGAPKTGGYYVC